MYICLIFFFFQAEDGIRDGTVTGVQTCALPISKGSISFLITGDEESVAVNGTVKLLAWASERGHRFDHCILGEPTNADVRSEEHTSELQSQFHLVCRLLLEKKKKKKKKILTRKQ